MTDDIFKIRSCRSCVSAALNVYSNNFAKIFRSTWIPAVLLSVIMGLNAFISSPATDSNPGNIVMPLIGFIAIIICTFVLFAHTLATVVSMLNGSTRKNARLKIMKANGLVWGVQVATSLLACLAIAIMVRTDFFEKLSPTPRVAIIMGTLTVMFVALLISLLPFVYSVTRYIFNQDTKFCEVFGMAYHKGVRRLGFLFQIAIVTTLIGMVAGALLCVPACVTFIAKSLDSYGVAQGDASGLPTYFSWLNFLSTTIMSFIVLYLEIWGMLTFFYAYGSIDAVAKTDNK